MARCLHLYCGTLQQLSVLPQLGWRRIRRSHCSSVTGTSCGSISQMVQDEESGPSPLVFEADLGSLKVDGELCSLYLGLTTLGLVLVGVAESSCSEHQHMQDHITRATRQWAAQGAFIRLLPSCLDMLHLTRHLAKCCSDPTLHFGWCASEPTPSPRGYHRWSGPPTHQSGCHSLERCKGNYIYPNSFC